MGSVGNNQSIRREEVKGTPLIFGIAAITNNYIDIDGYSNKKTLKGALGDLAKALDKYDKGESDALRTAISANEIEQIRPGSGESAVQYILEYEEVPSASRHVDANGVDTILSKRSDTYENFTTEYKDGKWYLHTRILR